jgi:microcin C transport system substrate-binding protein
MGVRVTRRKALALIGAGALAKPLWGAAPALADGETETYGLSAFGDLGLPADFPHFAYANPAAPKGGLLSIQITSTGGNQSFDTFDTLNTFSVKGDGAAGMGACFDSLMAGNADEPDAQYGLLAKSVRVSADKLTYKFLMRPEAKFFDGSRVKASDAAFSLTLLKTKGHPTFAEILSDLDSASVEGDDVLVVKFVKDRSRDAHLVVVGMPVFSEAFWKTHDFEATLTEPPLGSGAYKVGKFEQGRFIEYALDPNYWAKDLPVNVGQNNFERVRYEYYRDRQVAFEAFKSGALNFHREYTSRIWATGYDFPAIKAGKVKKESLTDGAPTGSQGWYLNTRRPQFKDPRIRAALDNCFDFEWTNKNVMYSSYKRVVSYFQNSPMEAKGAPGPEELKLLEPWRGKIPDAVFGDPYMPPVSDGSGSDRALLKKANEMLLAAGCKRSGDALHLPDGSPFVIEFLDSSDIFSPHMSTLVGNFKKLGIDAKQRIVDPSQYKARTESFDFDVVSSAFGGSTTPGVELRDVFFGPKTATTNGSRNLAGVADPAVDALTDLIAKAATRDDLNVACRALDRVLRAGHYWISQWYNDQVWLAFWDAFARPEHMPKLGSGAPETWWWDADKAKAIGL